jgi:hypothetical protein
MTRLALLAASVAAALLAGCELPGIESSDKLAVAREAEGKAVGAACRNAGRAIEDCFTLNKRTDKAAIVSGWRDMNDYMRENKVEAVPPVLVAQAGRADARGEAKADAKGEPKADAKAEAARAADVRAEADSAADKPRPKARDPQGGS